MAKSITKKKSSRLHFPQIRRKITAVTLDVNAKTIWRWLIILIVLSILILQLVQLGQMLYKNYYDAQLKKAQKRTIEAEIMRWEQIVRDRPNYRDAYFELAVLTYRLGHLEETKKYLARVFELDPNYQPARELEKTLQDN